MPKNKKGLAPSQKYVEVLDKFGLLPNFDFTKKEKRVINYLKDNGSADFLTLSDATDIKPEKCHKVINHLVAKGAVEVILDEIRLTSLALKYVHTKKEERKSAKKFYKFVDTLSDKELDDFMKLVSSFEVNPDALLGIKPELSEALLKGAKQEEEIIEKEVEQLAKEIEEAVEEASKEEEAPKPAPKPVKPASPKTQAVKKEAPKPIRNSRSAPKKRVIKVNTKQQEEDTNQILKKLSEED